MDQRTAERLAIQETLDNWVLWRDSGDWERFKTVWHPKGWMNATWFQGPAASQYMKRTGWTRSIRQTPSLSIKRCSKASPKGIVTSLICNPNLDSPSRRDCPD